MRPLYCTRRGFEGETRSSYRQVRTARLPRHVRERRYLYCLDRASAALPARVGMATRREWKRWARWQAAAHLVWLVSPDAFPNIDGFRH